MRKFKSALCLLLAAAMAFSLCGCFRWGGKDPVPNTPTQAATEKPADTDKPADPTAEATEQATEQATEVPTEAPDYNALFEELDLEIFRSLVTSSADVYNQFIYSDPAKFGIDPADVEPGWGDYYTEESHREYMDTCREMLGRLAEIDRGSLSERNQNAYDAIKRYYETDLMSEDYYYYDEPLTPMNGMHTGLPLSMVCFAIRSPEDAETYVRLLEDMPRIIDQIADYEVGKAEHGLFMTETALDQVYESVNSFAETGEDCFLISLFDTMEEKMLEVGVSQAECDALRTRSSEAVLNGILPAYSRLGETLIDLTGECSELAGAAVLGSDRKAYYDITVHSEGCTMEDIDALIERVEDMGDSMFTEMIYAMYSDPDSIERYGDPVTFGSIEEDMAWLMGLAEKVYPEMPEHEVTYVDIPEDIAEDFSPAAYLPPAFDNYYDNTILLNPTSDNLTQLFTLAHEGVPGHMYQFLYFRASEGLSLAQQVMEPVGYAEGWTVFTEYFVAQNCDELGTGFCAMMNAESIYGNIFLPSYISLQVNHNGWSKEDVMDHLRAYGLESAGDIFYEYAVTMPVYAMSYAVGFSYMYDLYNSQNLVTAAQHKEFFKKILDFGPTALDLLEEHMSN